jgi:pimeloyl-ACP methyl ester carboxylesterase
MAGPKDRPYGFRESKGPALRVRDYDRRARPSGRAVTMNIIDRGTGTAVVLIPGIQGRWEWMRPAVDALSKRCRVITFSLADEPTSGGSFDESAGFWSYVQQVNEVLERTGVRRATVCGVSYGGLIAASFAARHAEKVSALVLTSAIPPSWRPDARAEFFMRAPLLLSPLFCIGSLRMCPEIFAARGTFSGAAFAAQHATTVLTHMFSPTLMARRARTVATLDVERELARVRCPTLIVTGEPTLDRVVPVRLTRDYHRIWPHATEAVLERTGHLGLITKADDFARLVVSFADQNANRTSTWRSASGGMGAG